MIDPELDEPITELGFVTSWRSPPGGDVEVRLRLPTPQCAPNFAFLMAADARNALRGCPGVRNVTIMLEDHYTGQEINDAIARGRRLHRRVSGRDRDDAGRAARAVPRKALIARQSRCFEALLDEATTPTRCWRCAFRTCRRPERARGASSCARRSASPQTPTRRPLSLPDGEPLAADGLSAGCGWRGWCDQPRGQRRHLPLATGISPHVDDRTRGDCEMKAARLHAYHEPLKLDRSRSPRSTGRST